MLLKLFVSSPRRPWVLRMSELIPPSTNTFGAMVFVMFPDVSESVLADVLLARRKRERYVTPPLRRVILVPL